MDEFRNLKFFISVMSCHYKNGLCLHPLIPPSAKARSFDGSNLFVFRQQKVDIRCRKAV